MMRKKVAAATIRGILSASPCPMSVQTVAEVAGMDVAPTAEFLSIYHRQLKVHKTEDGRYVASDSWRIAIPDGAAEDVKRFLREHGPGNRRELSEGLSWVRMSETSSALAVFYGVTRWMLHRGELRAKETRGSRGTVYGLPDPIPHTEPVGSGHHAAELADRTAKERIRAIMSAVERPMTVADISRLSEVRMTAVQRLLEAGAAQDKFIKYGGFWWISDFWKVPGMTQARCELVDYLENHGPQIRSDMASVLPWVNAPENLRFAQKWFGVTRTLMDEGKIWVKDFRNAVAIGLIGQQVPSEPPRSIRRPVRPAVNVNPTATDELMTALCTPGSTDPTYD